MATKPVTVSQLNEYVARLMSTDPILRSVSVKGEITSLKYHQSGHVYFSISDSESRINCFLPADIAEKLTERLYEGESVVITGSVRVYVKGGYYSFYVKEITAEEGIGGIAEAFEKVKRKLDREGLFDRSHKLPLPKYPGHIAVISSETGAAIHDILKTLKIRGAFCDVTLFPAAVQGASAAASLRRQVELISDKFYGDIDLIIIGRGGGSPEDLAVFNDETLARAIYDCRIPVISAVGHEIDFSISDLVADLRAATPTAAAEAAVKDRRGILNEMEQLRRSVETGLGNTVMYDTLRCEALMKDIKAGAASVYSGASDAVEGLGALIAACDPRRILKRGYAVISAPDGRMIASASKLETGSRYIIEMADGKAGCEITDKGEEDGR